VKTSYHIRNLQWGGNASQASYTRNPANQESEATLFPVLPTEMLGPEHNSALPKARTRFADGEKHRYLTTLHGVRSQTTMTWIFTAVKTKNFASSQASGLQIKPLGAHFVTSSLLSYIKE